MHERSSGSAAALNEMLLDEVSYQFLDQVLKLRLRRLTEQRKAEPGRCGGANSFHLAAHPEGEMVDLELEIDEALSPKTMRFLECNLAASSTQIGQIGEEEILTHGWPDGNCTCAMNAGAAPLFPDATLWSTGDKVLNQLFNQTRKASSNPIAQAGKVNADCLAVPEYTDLAPHTKWLVVHGECELDHGALGKLLCLFKLHQASVFTEVSDPCGDSCGGDICEPRRHLKFGGTFAGKPRASAFFFRHL